MSYRQKLQADRDAAEKLATNPNASTQLRIVYAVLAIYYEIQLQGME